ncbi:MAG TPA: class I SAM-dependent methyltransferase [Flavobacterium sp.]
MDHFLLSEEVQAFINANSNASIPDLVLRKNPFPHYSWQEIINQIEAKAKAKEKLPTWFATKNIIFPGKISLEQTSSEKTAAYKSEIVSGDTLIDLSGGFGIDDYYFSKRVNTVIHCELNENLSDIVAHNFEKLGSENIRCIKGDSLQILQQLNRQFDWIYVDPSRRNDIKEKVFMLKDCLPNVPDLLSTYFVYSPNILIKTAPMLDITAGIKEFKCVRQIHIVAVENEVKELLWEIKRGYEGTIHIKTINSTKYNTEEFNFDLSQDSNFFTIGEPAKFLYEPNAAIMKSGCFNLISQHFTINKLHPNSHLYTSDTKITFPGRVFEIEHTIAYNKANMKKYLENEKSNITTRNFPETVAAIRKKWKIKDGGYKYCFFTTNHLNDKIVVICNKVN